MTTFDIDVTDLQAALSVPKGGSEDQEVSEWLVGKLRALQPYLCRTVHDIRSTDVDRIALAQPSATDLRSN